MKKNLRSLEPREHEINARRGVYRIFSKFSGKCYIGSSSYMKKRFASHKRSLKKGFHHSAKLQEEFNKYGEKNLIFNIVEEVFDVGLLSQREQFWINYYNSHIDGYNSCPIANSSLGFKHSVKTKLKMSLSGKKVKKDHPIKDKILILKKEIMKDKKLYIRKNGRCGLIAKNIGCSLQYLNKVLRQNI